MRYLKLIPLIIYPYAYLLYFFLIPRLLTDDVQHFLVGIFEEIIIVYIAIVIIISVVGIVKAAKGRYTAKDTSAQNLLIKLIHIPAYIFHFAMGIMGLLMSIWGFGLVFVAVIVDVLTIALSGFNAISCAVCLKKEKRINGAVCVLTAIGSFIFCIDVIIAIVWFIICRVNKRQPPKAALTAEREGEENA